MAEFRIDQICKSFVLEQKRLHVLNGVSITGDTDEITVILGKSGCGKTTLLRILCGLEKADSGSFSFPSGTVPGMVFQEPRLMPWLSVRENVEFGVPKAQRNASEIQAIIDVVGLTGFENAKPATLSGGMQHRAALARTLACNHPMVLMDEPFASLDYFTRATMQKELIRIHRDTHMGAIFVTHNIEEAILLGDRICILSEGVISAEFRQAPSGNGRDAMSEESIALKRKIIAELDAERQSNIKESKGGHAR